MIIEDFIGLEENMFLKKLVWPYVGVECLSLSWQL